MKKLVKLLAVLAFALAAVQSFADATYAYTNPTYIPTAVSAPATYSAPGNYLFTNQGLGAVSVRITGTCTNLAATLQGSNDGTKVSTDCDTGATALTGIFAPSATIGVVSYAPDTLAFAAPVSNQLYMTTTATTSIQGVLTYVQQ